MESTDSLSGNNADLMPSLTIRDGAVIADSRDVAAKFGKEHRRVLQTIRELECSDEFRLHHFVPFKIKDLSGESTSHVEMTEEGFSFLAMGFTGKEAARWKELYILAFKRMREELRTLAGGLSQADRAAIGGMLKGIVHKELTAILPGMVEAAIAADARVSAVSYKPALAVLVEKKVPPRRHRAFLQKVSKRLQRYSAMIGQAPRLSPETGRYLFPVEAINGWLAREGDGLIAEHIATVAGQGVLPFPRKGARR